MGPADKRVSDLLERWLGSVELHARHLDLDAAAYAQVQDWPKHQRPTRWVIDLARARLLDLKRHLAERQVKGDAEFADALELMSFLTTLLGSEHVERFIPLAVPRPAGDASPEAPKKDETSATTVVRPRGERRTVRRPVAPRSIARGATKAPAKAAEPSVAPAATATPATPTAPAAQAAPAAAASRPAAVASDPTPDKVAATVIADAVRLLNWGREWPQLAGLIARLADRPPEQEVWKVLRAHRATIEAQAKPPSS